MRGAEPLVNSAAQGKLHESEQENMELETKMELLPSRYQDCMDQIRAIEIKLDQSRNESEDLKNAMTYTSVHKVLLVLSTIFLVILLF